MKSLRADRGKFEKRARRAAYLLLERLGLEHDLPIGDSRIDPDVLQFYNLVAAEALWLFDKAKQLKSLPPSHNVVPFTLRAAK